MNSVKNLFVVVMLMGVSYGAIQVINTPDPTQTAEPSDVDEISIQMGERNHDSLQATSPPLASNFANGNSPPPTKLETGFPPLPPNTNRMAPPATSQGTAPSQPDLLVPELEMPKLDSSKPPATSFAANKAKTPAAFADSSNEVPAISAPAVTAPPISGGSFTMPPNNSGTNAPKLNASESTADSGSINGSLSGGGAFAANPNSDTTTSNQIETRMEPVSPKPTAPASGGNRFIDSANQFVGNATDTASNFQQNLSENINEKAGQFNQQVQQATQPALDAINQSLNTTTGEAAKMLDNSRAGILDRANEFTNKAEAGRDTVANLVTETVAPLAATVSPANKAFLPSPDASPIIDWAGINQMARNGQVKQALSTLTQHYSANLAEDQRLQMLEWLDTLAGKTIYSTEHLLQAAPYVVKQNDNLESLAQQWQVPARLIYMVNQAKINDPAMLVPGTELKVIQGPFNAMVGIDRQELTIFLGDMYAGRFPIEMGSDGNGLAHGTFTIREKSEGKDYVANGQSLAAGANNNPYGKYWLGLGDGFGIHEFNAANFPSDDRRGSIRVSSNDAADVYGILGNGSQVTITR